MVRITRRERPVLCSLGFLPREDFVAFAIEDADPDRLGRPLDIRRGDDRGGRVRDLNLFLHQIRWAAVGGPANELDPERRLLIRDDPRGGLNRIRLRRRRSRRDDGVNIRRPAGDDQCDAAPVSRGSVASALTLPAARFRIGVIAISAHERPRDGVDPLDPFQLPKQPCKHIRPLISRPERGSRA